jgi:hypothetical protein
MSTQLLVLAHQQLGADAFHQAFEELRSQFQPTPPSSEPLNTDVDDSSHDHDADDTLTKKARAEAPHQDSATLLDMSTKNGSNNS